MMTNKFIAHKIEEKNYEKILSLSEQTKNLFAKKISHKNNKIILKIKLKSPIHRVNLNKIRINNTKDFNKHSKFYLDNDLDNYKNNIRIVNYKLSQTNNYLIHSNKLINNISQLNKSYNDKYKILPNVNNSKLRNKSLVQTMAKFDLNPKKIYLKNLSKDIEDTEELNNIKIVDYNKIKSVDTKINKRADRLKLKKLLLMRNTTNYKIENNNRIHTEKNNRNSILLKKYFEQKMMNYDKLIKKMEEETELKKNVMNEYINLMKENFENGLKFD